MIHIINAVYKGYWLAGPISMTRVQPSNIPLKQTNKEKQGRKSHFGEDLGLFLAMADGC